MTEDPITQVELDYIYDAVGFHAGRVEQFVQGMDLSSLLACLGYVKGTIEAQVPGLDGAIDRIANLTRDTLYPRAVDQLGPPPEGKLKIYYPATADTKLTFPKGNDTIQ